MLSMIYNIQSPNDLVYAWGLFSFNLTFPHTYDYTLYFEVFLGSDHESYFIILI